jgi:hypothetical protein
MDINIQDVNYNKYLKYKFKYLELKQSGGGWNIWKAMEAKKKAKEAKFEAEINVDIQYYGDEVKELLKQFNMKKRKSNLYGFIFMRNDLKIILTKIIEKNKHILLFDKFNIIIEQLSMPIRKMHTNLGLHSKNNDTLEQYKTKIKEVFDLFETYNISNFLTLKKFICIYFDKINKYLLKETHDGA